MTYLTRSQLFFFSLLLAMASATGARPTTQPSAQAVLYEHCEYLPKGRRISVGPGLYKESDLRSRGFAANILSSLVLEGNLVATLYDGPDGTGSRIDIDRSAPCLAASGFNDKAKSVWIRRPLPAMAYDPAISQLDPPQSAPNTRYWAADPPPPEEWLVDIATDWMKHLPDDTPLGWISIPGTHDSAAVYSRGNLNTRTQNWSIKDQLSAGIRYLDLRVKLVKKSDADEYFYQMVHACWDQKQSLDQVLDQVREFLTQHPSEMIFARLKEDCDIGEGYEEEKKKIWAAYALQYDSIFPQGRAKASNYDDRQNKTGNILKNYRGKLYVLRNDARIPKTYGAELKTQPDRVAYTGGIWFQGVTGYTYTDSHMAEIRDLAAKARYFRYDREDLFLNHLIDNNIHGNPYQWAVALNSAFAAELETMKPRTDNIGVTIMDYPGERLIFDILNTNFSQTRSGAFRRTFFEGAVVNQGNTNMCLDVEHNSRAVAARGDAAIITECLSATESGAKRQLWSRQDQQLVHVATGMCLDLSRAEPGARPVLSLCREPGQLEYQAWNNQSSQFHNAKIRQFCLDVRDNEQEGRVVIANCHPANQKQFQSWIHVVSARSGFKPLINSKSGLCLSVSETRRGGEAELAACDSSLPAQKWEKRLDFLVNAESRMCLDLRSVEIGSRPVLSLCREATVPEYQAWEGSESQLRNRKISEVGRPVCIDVREAREHGAVVIAPCRNGATPLYQAWHF